MVEDRPLAAELTARLLTGSGLRGIGVTDLIALRRAFWRFAGPTAPISPEREARMGSGRLLHRWLGPLFAGDGALEVRVRRDGIVGRIDVLADMPIEVKTSEKLVAIDELLRARPEHLEQLGMYCSLTARTGGRLVTWEVTDGRASGVRTAEVQFRQLGAVEREMRARAAMLRAAWGHDRAEGLPRCSWFDRGCEYREARICDCTGTEDLASTVILDAVTSVAPRVDLDALLWGRLAALPPPLDRPGIERFRDLVYPRRTYFERTAALPREAPRVEPRSVTPDLFGRLTEAVEIGPIGEVASIPTRAEEPLEDVAGFRGLPYLVRTSRAWNPASAEEIVDRSPQYALELGFRCAVTGTASARVMLGHERAESDRDRLRVFEFRFAPMTSLARLWRTRSTELRKALAAAAPEHLPACPAWMYADCPYRETCGCGAGPGRSQR